MKSKYSYWLFTVVGFTLQTCNTEEPSIIEVEVNQRPCAAYSEYQEVYFDLRIKNNNAPPLIFYVGLDNKDILPETYTSYHPDGSEGSGIIDFVGQDSIMLYPGEYHDFSFQLEHIGEADKIEASFKLYLKPDVFRDITLEIIITKDKKGLFNSKNKWITTNLLAKSTQIKSPALRE